jgi:hypothetical protein
MSRSFGWREAILASVGFTLLAALVFGPLVLHGGFHFDDWSNGADTLYPPAGTNEFEHLAETTLFRPVLIVYVPLTYIVFDMHMWLHLAWSIALAVAVASLLYAALRMLDVPRLHAAFIAALVLIFPWFDGIRYWPTGAQVSLSLTFMLTGLVLALTGLRRGSLKWHFSAAALYLTSILTYEITLPLIAMLGALYVGRVGWREGRIRWGIDIVTAIVGGIWVGTHTERIKSGVSGDISHLREIIDGGSEIMGRSAIPLGGPHTALALILLTAIFAAGVAVYFLRPEPVEERQGWGLRNWLLLGAGGFAVTLLGWVILIPADPYYTPQIWGVSNRINGLAGIGLVILVYAAIGVLADLFSRAWRGRPNATALVISTCLGLLLLGGYLTVIRRHTGIWNAAYEAEVAAIDRIQERYPTLPHDTTLFISGYPAYQVPGVPILSSSWDVRGMVQDTYEDGTLNAQPVLEGLKIDCRPDAVALAGVGGVVPPPYTAPYGMARLFDLSTGTSARPLNRRACLAVAGEYQPGPTVLSYDY